jgi:hypothetical protein
VGSSTATQTWWCEPPTLPCRLSMQRRIGGGMHTSIERAVGFALQFGLDNSVRLSEAGCFQMFHTEIREQPDLHRVSIAVSKRNIERARNEYKFAIGRHQLQLCNRLLNGYEINAWRVKCHHHSVHIH